jgi:raffinose/stachyose/melibiose transport system substrate-binding protein
MRLVRSRRPAWALLAVAGSLALTTACSAGSLRSGGDSDSSGGKVTLNFLVDNGEATVKMSQQLAKDFTAANPNITVNVDTRPGGTDGDNLVKTRLSTGDMSDVFMYNSGSLFQAIKPQQNLVPLTGESWAGDLDQNFKTTVSAGKDVYGAPYGSFFAGAILYNRKVYDKLGLQVPTTWDEFMKNNAAIKKAGIDPIIQTYGETWTSQLFVLGDFHNVAAKEPDWATKYTANQVKYATDPNALKGFERLQQVHDAGYLNKDFASAKLNDGLKLLGEGKGVHFPMLTGVLPQLYDLIPSAKADVGVFPIPGDDASTNGLTVWSPNGLYIPKTTEGAKLDAAKKFAAFVASPAGCESQTKATLPTGPYAVKGCKLPADVPQAIKDEQNYFNRPGATSPALEFLSPVKGPSLEQITVEVGSGIRPARSGAARYDEDVKKQAQQLGLQGW